MAGLNAVTLREIRELIEQFKFQVVLSPSPFFRSAVRLHLKLKIVRLPAAIRHKVLFLGGSGGLFSLHTGDATAVATTKTTNGPREAAMALMAG